jgi:hypothetical protein
MLEIKLRTHIEPCTKLVLQISFYSYVKTNNGIHFERTRDIKALISYGNGQCTYEFTRVPERPRVQSYIVCVLSSAQTSIHPSFRLSRIRACMYVCMYVLVCMFIRAYKEILVDRLIKKTTHVTGSGGL